ncbi:LysR family transcriptional regulator [Amycolatopsis regifaucium]|uniref:LysR family transcriptional regulator n=1 Tax=Amycolatopsis regifaucium TaxID=546365 RepID=A0A154MVZ4_9PSEU|nr:LysR family transcriptional regulator [Amycolatopsis regifaucium]KZB88435.1 LysR family transcriptional regulator [Amycolatopsis regifaucium]OKA11516.1 LysR family transcriptional regulator [Amycolatopsis regifaucium]SFH42902.1 DNA-binding transcriptional regulator, LysR family [Amycolatopsis regifaucium]
MSDIDLRHLNSFLAVVRERSITAAGAGLHLTQQAVSTHIRRLERALGVVLLVRTSRGVLLTAAGEELAAGGAAVIDDVERLAGRVRAAARAGSGTLRLACCPIATSLFAVDVAEILEKAVEGVRVTLTGARHPQHELELLTGGQADAAFMWLPLGDVGLNHAVVRTDPPAVALSTTHPLAGRSALTLADIAGEPVVRPDVLVSAEAERFWLADPRPDGTPAPRGPLVPLVEDCLLEVGRGRGVWLAPRPLAAFMPSANVRWIPLTDAESFDLAVVWADHAPRPLLTRLIAEVRAITGYEA